MNLNDNKRVALRSFDVIRTGDRALAEQIIAADFRNLEAEDDPDQPERQQRGPQGFLATSDWLSGCFSVLSFEAFETLAEGDKVMISSVMTGRHTGLFQGLAPTGMLFRQRQIHLFQLSDGQITAHRAQRDDLGLLLQLGWPGARTRSEGTKD